MLNTRNIFQLGKAFLTRSVPVYAQFAVTNRCNCQCVYCSNATSRANEKELSLAQIKVLAQNVRRIGTVVIILTGGELLLREDAPQIIRAFADQGCIVRIQTNGKRLTPENLESMVAAGLSGVTLSLDTLDADLQDQLCRQEGIFESALLAISVLSKWKANSKAVLALNSVVTKKNLSHIPGVVEFATQLGFYTSVIPFHFSKSENYIIRPEFNSHIEELNFEQSDRASLDRLFSKLIQMKQNGHLIQDSRRLLEQAPEYMTTGLASWNCASPHLYYSISPSGMFLPCVDLPGTVSMLDPNFPQVYRSKAFVEEIKNQVRLCEGCLYPCYPEVVYLFEHPGTLVEKTLQFFKAGGAQPKTWTLEQVRDLAAKHHPNQPSTPS